MDPKNVMVNNALGEIKQAAASQHGAKQNPAIPRQTVATRGTKQHCCSDQRHQPERQMKKAILRVLKLQLLNGCRPAMRGHTDQMMPAQYLMKHDPVRKASETQAENEAGPDQWVS